MTEELDPGGTDEPGTGAGSPGDQEAEAAAAPEPRGRSSRRRPSLVRRALQLAGGLLALLVVGGVIVYLTSPNGSEYRRAWPKRTAYMQLRIDEARDAGRPLRIQYMPVSLSRIPHAVQRAVLVGEDAGFYGHGAFDWSEMRAAVEQAWREGESPRGASTITQQLARNLYLSPRRSLWRKIREAFIAVRLEHALPKRRILELYLNVIELGRGVFGVEAASEHYFGESVDALGRERAARLAATIPSPLHDNPQTDTREYRWRIGLIGPRAFPPDTAAVDTGAADLGADTAAMDTAATPPALPSAGTAAAPADTLTPDTIPVDTLRPDTLGSDTLAPDTLGPGPTGASPRRRGVSGVGRPGAVFPLP